jgi:hypothetical protein
MCGGCGGKPCREHEGKFCPEDAIARDAMTALRAAKLADPARSSRQNLPRLRRNFFDARRNLSSILNNYQSI